MCRLLCVVTTNPNAVPPLLEQFKEQFSETNPDGWGIGWYENGKAQLFKEETPAHDPNSQLSRFAKEVRSKLIIAHVRAMSVGMQSKENSHPFQNNNWLFVHNGTVDKDHLRLLLEPKYKQMLEGDTDSEVYFYWVLQNIEHHNNDVIEGVKNAIKEVISRRYTGINFLLSDGTSLYAFRYSQNPQDAYTLYKRKRNSTNSFEDAVLVCSEPVTDEEWDPINYGHMLIVHKNLEMREVQIVE